MDSNSAGSESRGSRLKIELLPTLVKFLTWIEMISGLSTITSAIFLNPRVPVFLYAIYGVYLGIFLWLMYSTCRSTYLQQGPLNYVYWTWAGCTITTIGVIVLTILMSPNAGEIAFIAMIVFMGCLVLFPFITAVFYCYLRGNFILPKQLQNKNQVIQGTDQPDTTVQKVINLSSEPTSRHATYEIPI